MIRGEAGIQKTAEIASNDEHFPSGLSEEAKAELGPILDTVVQVSSQDNPGEGEHTLNLVTTSKYFAGELQSAIHSLVVKEHKANLAEYFDSPGYFNSNVGNISEFVSWMRTRIQAAKVNAT